MGIVCGITSGRIVHDYHAAKLVQSGAYTGNIGCVDWYDFI